MDLGAATEMFPSNCENKLNHNLHSVTVWPLTFITHWCFMASSSDSKDCFYYRKFHTHTWTRAVVTHTDAFPVNVRVQFRFLSVVCVWVCWSLWLVLMVSDHHVPGPPVSAGLLWFRWCSSGICHPEQNASWCLESGPTKYGGGFWGEELGDSVPGSD